jgi:hypothetical protein
MSKTMDMSIHEQASLNILSYIDEGRLIRGAWSKEREGKHLGCLLHATGGYEKVAACPAELMPRWMAETTIKLFDGLPDDAVVDISKRYADLIGRWNRFTPSNWDHVLRRWLARVIDQAVDAVPASAQSENYWPAIEKACVEVKAALKSGDKAAAGRAALAARAAADAAYAARAAALAAYAAMAAAGRAALAARAAAYAAMAADAAADAADAAMAAANKSLFDALLDEIEAEINLMRPGIAEPVTHGDQK